MVLTIILNSIADLEYAVNNLANIEASNSQITTITNVENKKSLIDVSNLEPIETNQIIIKFKDESQLPRGLGVATERANLEKAQGLKHVLTIKGIDAQVYEVSETDTAFEVVDRILATKKDVIEYAELDRIIPPAFIPDDPMYVDQWHLPKIEAHTAWDITQGTGVIIAILDSGVNSQHPDLAGQLVSGWNLWDNNDDTTDLTGHGTLVTGAVAAISNNGAGVAAVAGQSKIMPIRITEPTVGGAYDSTITQGLIYAADHGAQVANISYRDVMGSAASRDAAQYMRNKNGLVTVSAGNNGVLMDYIATPTMIQVSATDQKDVKTSFSNYGYYVDLAAPGIDIWTTDMYGNYAMKRGTSFSSPVVAATLALIFSANPALTSVEAENILFSSVDDLGESGWDMYYGHGRVNANKAVATALATKGVGREQDTIPPTTPTNLNVNETTASTVLLSWLPSTDNVLVTGYNLYRDGVKIRTATTTNVNDSGLSAYTTYKYKVTAVDQAGNESISSNEIPVTTAKADSVVSLAITSYSVPTKTNNSATVAVNLNKSGMVTVKYGTSSSNLSFSASSVTSNTSHSIGLTALSANTTYYYQVIAIDGDGKTVSSPVTSFKTTKGGGGTGGSKRR